MSTLGPIDSLDRFPWSYEIDFTAGDAAEQYERAGLKCMRSTATEYVDSNRMLRTSEPYVPVFEHDLETGRARGLRCEPARVNLLQNTENLAAWAPWYSGLPGLKKGFPDPRGGSDAWSFRVADLLGYPGDQVRRMGGIINTGVQLPVEGSQNTFAIYIRCDVTRNFRIGFSDAMRDEVATPRWRRVPFTELWTAAKDGGRIGQLLFGFHPDELITGAVSPDTRVYLYHPTMTAGPRETSYLQSGATAQVASADFHYADLLPMFAGYNPEGCIFIEWEQRPQVGSAGLFQMSMAGAAPNSTAFFADVYPVNNEMNVQQFWHGQISSVAGPMRSLGRSGAAGIQRLGFGWYKSGHHPPGASINGQGYQPLTGATSVSAGVITFGRFLLGHRIWNEPLDGYIRKLRFSARFNPNIGKDYSPGLPTAQMLSEMTNDRLVATHDFV